mgnify:CR=1 FL=1
MNKFGLIGYPLGHSFSKNFFNEKFNSENINAEYVNFEIPTIDGRARIKINPGTQPGTTLRLRGKGFPAVQGYGYGRGDIVVNISVYIPETLSKDEKKTIENFRKSDNFRPTESIKEKIFRRFKSFFD